MDASGLEFRRYYSALLIIKLECRQSTAKLFHDSLFSLKSYPEDDDRFEKPWVTRSTYSQKRMEIEPNIENALAEFKSQFRQCEDSSERRALFVQTANYIRKAYDGLIQGLKHLTWRIQAIGRGRKNLSEAAQVEKVLAEHNHWYERLCGLYEARIIFLDHDPVKQRYFLEEWSRSIRVFKCKQLWDIQCLHACFRRIFGPNSANRPAFQRLLLKEKHGALLKMESTLQELTEAIKNIHDNELNLERSQQKSGVENKNFTIVLPMTMVCPLCSKRINLY